MRSDCPVSYSLDLFGDKWTLLIVRDLIQGKRFYKDFQNSKEGIATNILADRLKKLENAGIIQWKTFAKLKTKKEYSLTEKGKDLIPLLVELTVWSAQHQEGMAVSEYFLKRAQEDREGLIESIRARVN